MMKLFNRKPKPIDLKDVPDTELVELAKTSKDAFGELYERYVTKIYNYIYYRTGNHHDAEDLTARVFFRAIAHIETYTDRGVPFQAWLYRIAHNLVANWHRDRSRRKIIPLDEFIASGLRSESPDAYTEDREERALLLAAIRRLPEERQQLLVLKFVERLSNAEVGVIMDRTEGAIKSLYHRTLIALRNDLQALQSDQPGDVEGGNQRHPLDDAAGLLKRAQK
ncbi:MAG: sigma-70 family RNA polymerase sigma factor [Burkholderiales bacterium]|nr:sigma-70 family RNA polymerase sigma factor [Anaerolineae bacterium]